MATKTITHWIDGKALRDARGGAARRRVQPGDRRGPGPGRVRDRRPWSTRRSSRPRAPSQTWRSVSIAKRTKILFAFRQLVDKHQHEIAKLLTLEHGKVTGDALGEVNRGLEVIEFACGIADLAKGEYSENVSTEVDSLLDPPAARRRRRHHAVQLPGDGADVDVPDRDRVREHVRAEAERARPVVPRTSARSCSPTPACRRACSTSSTATRSRSIACSSTRRSPRSRSSARRRSRSTSTRPAPGTASACRRSAARRTT